MKTKFCTLCNQDHQGGNFNILTHNMFYKWINTGSCGDHYCPGDHGHYEITCSCGFKTNESSTDKVMNRHKDAIIRHKLGLEFSIRETK